MPFMSIVFNPFGAMIKSGLAYYWNDFIQSKTLPNNSKKVGPKPNLIHHHVWYSDPLIFSLIYGDDTQFIRHLSCSFSCDFSFYFSSVWETSGFSVRVSLCISFDSLCIWLKLLVLIISLCDSSIEVFRGLDWSCNLEPLSSCFVQFL